MKTNTTIYGQHGENADFISRLAFYKDEVRIMQHLLDEAASRNTTSEFQTEASHFQNQLFIQRANISTLRHEVSKDEASIRNEIRKNEVAIDHRAIPDHASERENIKAFELAFAGLRKDLSAFVAKWM